MSDLDTRLRHYSIYDIRAEFEKFDALTLSEIIHRANQNRAASHAWGAAIGQWHALTGNFDSLANAYQRVIEELTPNWIGAGGQALREGLIETGIRLRTLQGLAEQLGAAYQEFMNFSYQLQFACVLPSKIKENRQSMAQLRANLPSDALQAQEIEKREEQEREWLERLVENMMTYYRSMKLLAANLPPMTAPPDPDRFQKTKSARSQL